MNIYLTLAIVFVLGLLQSTLMPHITIWGVHPDLVLMVVTSWSLLRGAQEGMLWALLGGIACDLFSGGTFGVCTLPLLLVSFASSLGESNVFRFDLLIPILVIPLATLVYNGIIMVLLGLLGWPVAWGDDLVRIIFPAMLVNTLAMPLVYLVMRTLDRHTGREEISW
jgi:rod shape-determining protein MreD